MKGTFEKKDKFGFRAKHTVGFRGFPPMFHPHCEMIMAVKGSINMMIGGRELTLEEGEISAVFPYVVHSYENAPETEFYMLLFDPDVTGAFENDLLQKRPVDPVIKDSTHLVHLFQKITELSVSDDIIGSKTAAAYLSAAVGELLRALPLCDAEDFGGNMVKPILLYCSDHFSDEDISIKKVADALYISSSYVSKVFSDKLKYGFREYINELRVAEAKKLLSKTDRKIVDVMLECGFRNQSTFNRVFADICGTSPKEYRHKKTNQY